MHKADGLQVEVNHHCWISPTILGSSANLMTALSGCLGLRAVKRWGRTAQGKSNYVFCNVLPIAIKETVIHLQFSLA